MAYILIFISPLLNFLLLTFFGSLLGYNGCCFITGLLFSIMLISSSILVWNYLFFKNIVLLNFGSWINFGPLNVTWLFVFDGLSLLFLLLVVVISWSVHIYSFFYVFNECSRTRFISYLSLFTFFMILLVTSVDLVVLFLGWEGVGLCSFLLISFWNSRLTACKAGLKAVLFNKVGDLAFLIAIAVLFFTTQSTNIFVIGAFFPFFCKTGIVVFGFGSWTLVDLVVLLVAIAAISKSAQIGMHVWLLDAMEGPTPVSALIHSATMVTAGVFVMVRLSCILEYSGSVKIWITVLGIVTSFLAALVGLLHNDLKSIIAYSTCSQLGYMVALCGLSAYHATFFHLFNHGFFKALLFLSAGLVIHSKFEEQDIRRMGGLYYLFPLSFSFFIVGSLSLAGIPYLSGFYSKDYLIDFIGSLPFFWSNLVYQISVLSALFTGIYSWRVLKFVFFSHPRSYKTYYVAAVEGIPIYVIVVLLTLAILSIFSGFLFKDVFIGNGTNLLSDSIFFISPLIRVSLGFDFWLLDYYYLWAPWKTGLVYLICVALRLYSFTSWLDLKFYESFSFVKVYYFVYNGFFFNFMYISWLLPFLYRVCIIFFVFDRLFLELYFGPRIITHFFTALSHYLFNLHLSKGLTSLVYVYLYSLFLIFFVFAVFF